MVLIWNFVAVAAAVLPASGNSISGYGFCPASDKCLKAVKANGNARRDCKDLLRATVTAPCKTIIHIARTTKLSTHTKAVVKTVTSTDLSATTITSITTSIPVITDTITTTVTPTISLVPRNTAVELEARDNKRLPPDYAGKSCNTNQYKSACSCIGVRVSTVTIPGRTTKITRTSTCFATTVVSKTRVETKIVTKTSNSINIETETGATRTEITTATETANPDDAIPIINGPGCEPSIGRIYKLRAANGGPYCSFSCIY